MAELQPHSRSNTPSLAPPLRRPLEEDHAPAVSSPLNPNPDPAVRSRPARAPPREQREKRDTLKKREASANTRGNTPNPKGKQERPSAPSPMRFSIPEPKLPDYEAPKDGIFASHEPNPIFTPDGEVELKKPVDQSVPNVLYYHSQANISTLSVPGTKRATAIPTASLTHTFVTNNSIANLTLVPSALA